METKNKKTETNCPIAYALSFLEGKWKLKVLYAIYANGTIRFNELRRQLDGISNLMLSKTLQELEDGRIVTRVQYNEVPPRVEYSLSEIGKGIENVMESLGRWGEMLSSAN